MLPFPMILGSKRIRWGTDAVNIVADGNSIMAGVFATSSAFIPTAVCCATAPISAGSITPSNQAAGGQTFDDMIASHTDVDAAWNGSKINFLFIFEATNQIINVGSTGAVTAGKLATYIAAVKAVHPWRVIVLTTTPGNRTSAFYPTVAGFNAEIDAYNALVRANYLSYGAEAVCEMRPTGGPFDISSYTQADFDAIESYYYTVEAAGNNELHMSDLGNTYMGQRMAATLATLNRA